MRLEYYPVEKLKTEIAAILLKLLDLREYRVFFFGSRVRGDNFPRADIDIGVEGSEEMRPAVKAELEEELGKIPTLYKFDLIDFKSVSEKFRQEALKYTEAI